MAKWKRRTSMEHPGHSPLMAWMRDHVDYSGDDCLIWPFSRTRDGYGTFGRNGKVIKVHRYFCQIVNGDPPSHKHHAAHSCGNGHLGCVNPRHVQWKSPRDNQNERLKHGRPFTGRRRKFTPEQIAEIRSLKGKEVSRAVAGRFDVSEAAIRQIWAGKIYGHIPIPSAEGKDQ
jgi:hypothetical protein